MRPSRRSNLPLSALLLLPAVTLAASSVDCPNVLVDGIKYDLSALDGAHTVIHQELAHPPHNQTFTLNFCRPLEKIKSDDDLSECKQGANICGVKYLIKEDGNEVDEVRTIAGSTILSHGKTSDPKFTRLKDSDSNDDSEKDGLRLEMVGGQFPFKGKGTKQKALIEFICDPEVEGVEGLGENDPHFKPQASKPKRKRADDDDDDDDDGEKDGDDEDEDDGGEDGDDDEKDDGRPLKLKSYRLEHPEKEDVEVLRLEWRTKYACENTERDTPEKSKSSWGFFTWFIIILFLAVAAYLVFGSWLNYSRYGARGWDLLPHGDTIRDLPYLLKDWARRVTGSFSGSGSRGGYSAV